MAVVGAGPENAPIIERTLDRLIGILEPFVGLDRFLFGSRPSLADFGLFGQLKTLCTDPTPAALIRRRAPRLEHWVRRADDLSGVEGDWQSEANPNGAVLQLLEMVGHTYLPFLTANAAALKDDKDEVNVQLRDGTYRQRPFGYQAKCLSALISAFAALSQAQKERAAPILRETNCLDCLG